MGISYMMTELFPLQNNHINIKVCQCVSLVKLQMLTAAMKLKDGLLLGKTHKRTVSLPTATDRLQK